MLVDICSGFGLCSMFLSELLLPSKEIISKIWLIDYNFPSNSNPNPIHVQQIFYDNCHHWPVPLRFRKTNIKKSREMKQLTKYVFNDNNTDAEANNNTRI